MKNIPKVKIAIVAVSRDCFPQELAIERRNRLMAEYTERYGQEWIYECPICVSDNELSMKRALKDIEKEGCNALCVFLGNFGPEITETMLAQEFKGPVMFCASVEEDETHLKGTRGDAYCGMLNASYALHLRKVQAYIPNKPVGNAIECSKMVYEFIPIAKAIIGIRNLKIISFGPRPNNFLACNAPIQQLYDLGIEIEENSELDLLEAYSKHNGDPRINNIVKEMEIELGAGNTMPEILPKLAQYEITLSDWIRTHKGNRQYITLTTKCWPAFQSQFGFVPCYVNSRLTAQGIPVSCEVDIYGALSEYIGMCISEDTVTILDINNTVPEDMYVRDIYKKKFNGKEYKLNETFMAFHCGNTCASKLTNHTMKNQYIMSRVLSDDVTKGTLEGDLQPGKITLFRIQGTSDYNVKAYVAEGQILPVATKSFGCIGIFAIPEMERFYRNVLIEQNFPHHGAIVFGHYGKKIYETYRCLGLSLENIEFNHPKSLPYVTEDPYDLYTDWY